MSVTSGILMGAVATSAVVVVILAMIKILPAVTMLGWAYSMFTSAFAGGAVGGAYALHKQTTLVQINYVEVAMSGLPVPIPPKENG